MRIANILHRGRKGEQFVVVWQLTAFFDESSHPRDPKAKMFGMSCCFAPAKVWAALERQWQHRLDHLWPKHGIVIDESRKFHRNLGELALREFEYDSINGISKFGG
jgi:nitrate/TMAO reductase-like tetraheme cytochrome c subunit